MVENEQPGAFEVMERIYSYTGNAHIIGITGPSGAGIMKIGDIFVVNKADKDGADRLVTEIKIMLELGQTPRGWIAPIIKTVATENQNIDILVEKIGEHREFLTKSGMLDSRRKERIRSEITKIAEHEIFGYYDSLISENKDIFDQRLEHILARKENPYQLAKQVVEIIGKKIGAMNRKPFDIGVQRARKGNCYDNAPWKASGEY